MKMTNFINAAQSRQVEAEQIGERKLFESKFECKMCESKMLPMCKKNYKFYQSGSRHVEAERVSRRAEAV